MKKLSKREQNAVIEKMYRAVAKYVEMRGGTALVAGGIQIMHGPLSEFSCSYSVCIKITGRVPKFVKEKA